MIPFEREIFYYKVLEHVKKENERIARENQAMKSQSSRRG